MRIGAGVGVIVSFLLPIVLLLFGVLNGSQTVSGVLLLNGVWAVAYGALFGRVTDKLYYIGIGIIVIVLSTFIFLPLQYVVGLVLLSVIALALTTVLTSRKKP